MMRQANLSVIIHSERNVAHISNVLKIYHLKQNKIERQSINKYFVIDVH